MTLSWPHHTGGTHRIHGPGGTIPVHDYGSMAKVFEELNLAPGNDGARSMSSPLLWQSMSLLALPGAPPYGAPRAAMWAMDCGNRAGQFGIYGDCCPGQAYLSEFRRRGAPPTFCRRHSCHPRPCLPRQEIMFLSTLDNEAKLTSRVHCNGRVR